MIVTGIIPTDQGDEFELSFDLAPMAKALMVDVEVLADCFKTMTLTIVPIKKDK